MTKFHENELAVELKNFGFKGDYRFIIERKDVSKMSEWSGAFGVNSTANDVVDINDVATGERRYLDAFTFMRLYWSRLNDHNPGIDFCYDKGFDVTKVMSIGVDVPEYTLADVNIVGSTIVEVDRNVIVSESDNTPDVTDIRLNLEDPKFLMFVFEWGTELTLALHYLQYIVHAKTVTSDDKNLLLIVVPNQEVTYNRISRIGKVEQ